MRCRTGKSIIIELIIYFYLQKDSRTVNTPTERGEYEPISQPPERTEYTYELEQLQSTNTCGVGRGTCALLHAKQLFGANLSEPLSIELAGAFLWYIFVSMGSPFGPVRAPRKSAMCKRKAG